MTNRRFKPEALVQKLRHFDVLMGQLLADDYFGGSSRSRSIAWRIGQ